MHFSDGTAVATQSEPVSAALKIARATEDRAPDPVDPPDFTRLFERECAYVWTSLRRLGVRERDLEDLVHDTFLVVHRHLSDYDPRRPIRPWLFGIAFRIAASYRRLARNEREVPSDQIEAIDPIPPADELVAQRQAQVLVMKALDTLDIDRRGLLLMHDFDGCPMPEIAETLGVPLNTAYSRLRLAREQFANACRKLQAKRRLR